MQNASELSPGASKRSSAVVPAVGRTYETRGSSATQASRCARFPRTIPRFRASSAAAASSAMDASRSSTMPTLITL